MAKTGRSGVGVRFGLLRAFLANRFALDELSRELVFRGPIDRGAMGRKSEINKFLGAEVFMFPKVTKAVLTALEAQSLPGIVKWLWHGVEVENGNVDAIAGFRSGQPDGGFVRRDDGMAAGGMLIDADQLGIGERGLGPVVAQSEIAAHDER